MYRVSPFTYLISAMLSTAVSGASATCSDTELKLINPPGGQTCQEYLGSFLQQAGGTLRNGGATSDCQYCGIETTDSFLSQLSINVDDDWRNFGLMWVYIVFNIAAALALYWLGRMPHNWGRKKSS
jgi:ATP-binding cassette, subfamily G (WHITE), member 2, PDR